MLRWWTCTLSWKKCSTWDSSIEDIHPIPSQLIPFTGKKVGRYGYAFSSLLESVKNAHLQHAASPPYQSQVHVQNESMSEDIPIGSFMGLISGSLRNMVLEILGGPTSVPSSVQPHYVLFIFAFIGVANAQAKWRQGNFRILPQFWSLSHGKGLLRSIEVENLCGDVRKHAPPQAYTQSAAGPGTLRTQAPRRYLGKPPRKFS